MCFQSVPLIFLSSVDPHFKVWWTLQGVRGQRESVWEEMLSSVSCLHTHWLGDSVTESRTLLSMSRSGLYNRCGSQTLAASPVVYGTDTICAAKRRSWVERQKESSELKTWLRICRFSTDFNAASDQSLGLCCDFNLPRTTLDKPWLQTSVFWTT